MNIEIANRLVELRKKNGLSQEELADKLGLSRQAVSKWERAEASPDTDNLICLAKLYGVSLDSLLDTDQSVEDIAREVKENKEEGEDEINIGSEGIHLKDGKTGDQVHIDSHGIHVFENGKEVDRSKYHHKEDSRGWMIAKSITFGILMAAAIAGYVTLGCLNPLGWAACWVLLLVPFIIDSILNAISKRNPDKVAIALIALFFYIPLGFYAGLWHPLWVIFLAVPVYHGAISPFTKHNDKKEEEKQKEEE